MRVICLGLVAAFGLAGPTFSQEVAPAPPDIMLGDPLVVPDSLDAGEEIPEDPYYDDRSTAASVIESFYNAINRAEYLRAWSYFAASQESADPEALQADFDAFAEGYATTDSVQLLVGTETTEGTAGTVYYTLPVALEATMADGTAQSFSGCYTLSLAQPSVQEVPPFQPLAITGSAIEPAEGSVDTILPGRCEL